MPTITRPRGMDEARQRAFSLPSSRPSVDELPYPVESEDGYLEWLPRPILGKVHQHVAPGNHGPVLELNETAMEWSVVGSYQGRSYPPPKERERKPRRRKVRAIMQDPGVEPVESVAVVTAMPVALTSDATRKTASGSRMALAPAVSVATLSRRFESAVSLAPADRRAAMRARRGY